MSRLKMPLTKPWPIRAIQLDLARHMETVEYICHYTDESARQGYNRLVLYLEGRVCTGSFPYRPPEASYSLDDMRRVVDHAARRGLEVIPVVSTLGHAEQFLACPELADLAEVRNGRGRWGAVQGHGNVFCSSSESVYEFLATYLTEVASVFPSPHFHVGLDEAFDLGFCSQCMKRWKREGLEGLFVAHIRRVNKIVCSLGKRMWMWDDFFELFPEALKRIPQDIVLCHWNYDYNFAPNGARAHFVNRWRHDWLRTYDKLGLDVVVCPCDRGLQNTERLTDHARRRTVWGGLQTVWETTPRRHPIHTVIRAYTGARWLRPDLDADRVWAATIRAAAPGASSRLIGAMQAWVRHGRANFVSTLPDQPVVALVREDHLQREVARAALEAIQAESARKPGRKHQGVG